MASEAQLEECKSGWGNFQGRKFSAGDLLTDSAGKILGRNVRENNQGGENFSTELYRRMQGKISGVGNVRRNCAGKVRETDYNSLRVLVMIYATYEDTRTDTDT